MANSVLVRSIAFLCLLSLSLSLHLVLAFVDRPALTVPSSGKRQGVSTKATSSSSSTAAAAATFTSEESAKSQKKASSSRYIFENYDKPIVLLGLSSSPANDEIRRLALSLSGSLAGNDPRKLKDAKDTLERSQGAGLIDSYHDDDFDDFDDDDIDSIIAQVNKEKEEEVIGIALSALGLDDEGPFVLHGEMIGEFIHDKILTLTTGDST